MHKNRELKEREKTPEGLDWLFRCSERKEKRKKED